MNKKLRTSCSREKKKKKVTKMASDKDDKTILVLFAFVGLCKRLLNLD